MEDLLFIVFMIVVGSLMYSGGRNPIQYYEDQKRKESERQRLRIARDSFIAEMKDLGSDLDVSKKSKNRSEWAVAKDFFLKSNEWKNIRQEVFKKYGRQCLKCGSRSRVEVDHIVPVYDNPWLRLNFDNLQPLCHSCNSIKGTSTADYRSSYNAMSGAESSLDEDETDNIIEELIDEFGLDDGNNLDESYQINLLVTHFKKIKVLESNFILNDSSYEFAKNLLSFVLSYHKDISNSYVLGYHKDISNIEDYIESDELEFFGGHIYLRRFTFSDLIPVNLISGCEEYWNWDFLSAFGKSPWSADFIAKYEDHWNWHILSRRDDLPWSIDFIKRFEKKWDWTYFSSEEGFTTVPCDELFTSKEDFIEEFEDNWDWSILSANNALPWTIDFDSKFSDRFCEQGLKKNANYQLYLKYEVFHDYD